MLILNMLMAMIFGSLMMVISVSNFAYSQDFACDFTQITDTIGGINSNVRTNSDGTLIVFNSDHNLTGANVDGNAEVYLYDVNTSTFTQATDTLAEANISPTISSDGSLVVFASGNDIGGDNADGNRELFLLDTQTLAISQLTDTIGGGTAFSHRFPIINSNGTHIAFVSNRDHTGENADTNAEVFLLDIDSLSFTQLTDTTGTTHNLRAGISADGTIVSFPSQGDLTGNNVDLSQELFIYDANTDTITQATDTTGSTVNSNRIPAVSPDGSFVTFESDLDLTGENPDGDVQIFLYDVITDNITQIVMTDFSDRSPKFSADGSYIIFSSLEDITGDNPGNSREIFLYDLVEDMFLQYTALTGSHSFSTTFNSDLTFLAASNSSDLTGDNPDENSEVFIAECIAILQNIDNGEGGGGGCTLSPSDSNLSDLSLLMILPLLIIIRRLIKQNNRTA